MAPLLYAYPMTLGVTLMAFDAALGTKALRREPVADEPKRSAALVTALHHDLHQTLRRLHSRAAGTGSEDYRKPACIFTYYRVPVRTLLQSDINLTKCGYAGGMEGVVAEESK